MMRSRRVEEKVRTRGAERIHRFQKAENRRLDALQTGQWIEGQVMRLVQHGAWVDVASQLDGFLHVSEIKNSFVYDPADELTPGQQVSVQVKHVDPEAKKLTLSLIGSEDEDEGQVSPHDGKARTPLHEIEDDQQLWAVVRRVTTFGAFVDVGAEKDAFLHLYEYPERQIGEVTGDAIFKRGQRVRCYAKEVDLEFNRLKVPLTTLPLTRHPCTHAPVRRTHAFILTVYTPTHAQQLTHARVHTRSHARARARARTRTHTHARTNTRTPKLRTNELPNITTHEFV